MSTLRGSMITLRPTHYMDSYSFYRCGRKDGRRGYIVCYVSSYHDIQLLSEFESEAVESLWLLFRGQRMPRLVSHVVVGIVYFPPNGDCAVTVTRIIDCLDKIMQRHPNAGIILWAISIDLMIGLLSVTLLNKLSVQQLGRIMCLIKYTQI